MFHLPCDIQIRNIQENNKMHSNVYDVFHSLCSHQHVSAAIAAIFRVTLLLQDHKVQVCLAVSPSLHNN